MSSCDNLITAGLHHGGRLNVAASEYGIPRQDWLDLSTGLNPQAWPVQTCDATSWQRLPEEEDGLQQAACEYYGSDYALPVAGSQAAIQLLPTLRAASRVAVIVPGYAEHEYNWQQNGHSVIPLAIHQLESHLPELDVVVIINPNNPDGHLVPVETLLSWHQQLSLRGGWLIVDEAFMDTTPEKSIVPYTTRPGLIVLRSMGKFFGLAGIRCGFVLSDRSFLQHMASRLGPWTLTGMTRAIARDALQDSSWQKINRQQLERASIRLKTLLERSGFTVQGGTALFQYLQHPRAKEIHDLFAQHAILLRYYPDMKNSLPALRFGLPASENDWQRLQQVLNRTEMIGMIKQMTGSEIHA